jgi:hypothetical protein
LARDGAGVYTLPAGNPVVSGETISSTTHNSTNTDIETALTGSLTKNGEAVISGTQDFNGNKLILDTDGDTSITADTDDIIDLEIAGTDAVKIGWQKVADTGFITLDPTVVTADSTENTHRLSVLSTRAITVPAGTTNLVSSVYIDEPNVTATGTLTNAATVYIKAAPSEGSNNYSFWVASGATKLGGTLESTGAITAAAGITSGSDILSDTDSTDSLGSTTVRWLKGWFDTLTAGTLTIGAGSIVDSSGAISFGNENLTTTGTLAAGVATLTTGSTIGNLTLANGSITDSSGAISFSNENLSTTGTLAAGVTTLTGDATVNSGNLVIGTSGKGIDFSATSDGAGMTAELFDDYEEGTWVPTLMDASLDGTGEGQNYDIQYGDYTKIGRTVHFTMSLRTTTIGTLTTGDLAIIGGLPYTPTGTRGSGFLEGGWYGLTGNTLALADNGVYTAGQLTSGSAYFYLNQWSNSTGSASFTIATWSSDGHMNISGSYKVD